MKSPLLQHVVHLNLAVVNMKPILKQYCQKRSEEFALISEERKVILKKIAAYVRYKENDPIQLLFVCTHNSRRSHLGQVWAKTAANFYGLTNVETFSGGTEVTAIHPNITNTLTHTGFDIAVTGDKENAIHHLIFDKADNAAICYSKLYDDEKNPSEGFGAIMTCDHADENCPFIPGAELRIALTYIDPKVSDGTSVQDETYLLRSTEIAREMLFLFSQCV